ncbi:SPOR domain-containing protein [Pseudomonas sp.]|uniref:SPOR domain-containing protein n=1 Tax=Pseudomonas sp. TaxID=306 RepID=UPI0028AC790A|nr:SPOR domain-containing protein [Pseudomonas sp.]
MQRIVGALVLVALAVIFVPMLFNREDPASSLEVDAPRMPEAPPMPATETQPVEVPGAPPVDDDYEIVEQVPTDAPTPPAPITPALAPAPQPQAPEPAPQPAEPAPPPASAPSAESHLDSADLPVSWSVQLASLSSRDNADKLQKTLRSQGYNAYIRTADGMNRVFVGPLVQRDEADRLRDQLERQQKLNGFVVRFKPESR